MYRRYPTYSPHRSRHRSYSPSRYRSPGRYRHEKYVTPPYELAYANDSEDEVTVSRDRYKRGRSTERNRPISDYEPEIYRPKNYRIIMDCIGYDPNSITTDFIEGKLIVTGQEKILIDNDDYSISIFKKSYKLPRNADVANIVKRIDEKYFIMEIPLRYDEPELEYDLYPLVYKTKDNRRMMKLRCALPGNTNPDCIKAVCRNNELVIKCDDKPSIVDNGLKIYFGKNIALPQFTDVARLRCIYRNDTLFFEAPINPHSRSIDRVLKIETIGSGTTGEKTKEGLKPILKK